MRKTWDLETDVLVVGYGLAGGVAASIAHDGGADVLILEKNEYPGGCSIFAGGGAKCVEDADKAPVKTRRPSHDCRSIAQLWERNQAINKKIDTERRVSMKRMMNQRVIVACLAVLWMFMSGSKDVSGAETPADFFRGKNVSLIYSGDAGAPVDLITRIIAPFLAKDLGAKVRVENKKTDEGVNYLYNQGTRDGLTLCTKNSNAIIGNEILKAPGVLYETEKFNFVSDVYPTLKMFQISPKLSYKTLDALRKAKGLRAGATSAKGSLAIAAAVMSEILGLDAKVITGFKGKQNLTMAVARGEIDFIVTTDNVGMKDEKDGFVINLFAIGDRRSSAVPHAPSLSELGVKVSQEMAAAHKFVVSDGVAVFLPPGVPRERVEYLRKVFQNLGNNRELQKELERLTGDTRPFAPGQELQEQMTIIKSDKELANRLDVVFKKYTAVR